jgi:hypothetical protein
MFYRLGIQDGTFESTIGNWVFIYPYERRRKRGGMPKWEKGQA